MQAISWTKDGLVYWHIYVSLGLSEWTHSPIDPFNNHLQTLFSDIFPWIWFQLKYYQNLPSCVWLWSQYYGWLVAWRWFGNKPVSAPVMNTTDNSPRYCLRWMNRISLALAHWLRHGGVLKPCLLFPRSEMISIFLEHWFESHSYLTGVTAA